MNKKLCAFGFTPGSVVEIKLCINPNKTYQQIHTSEPLLSQSMNAQSFFSFQSKTDFNGDHLCPILLKITEDSMRDDIPIGL